MDLVMISRTPAPDAPPTTPALCIECANIATLARLVRDEDGYSYSVALCDEHAAEFDRDEEESK